jgi:hypothetical protein
MEFNQFIVLINNKENTLAIKTALSAEIPATKYQILFLNQIPPPGKHKHIASDPTLLLADWRTKI